MNKKRTMFQIMMLLLCVTSSLSNDLTCSDVKGTFHNNCCGKDPDTPFCPSFANINLTYNYTAGDNVYSSHLSDTASCTKTHCIASSSEHGMIFTWSSNYYTSINEDTLHIIDGESVLLAIAVYSPTNDTNFDNTEATLILKVISSQGKLSGAKNVTWSKDHHLRTIIIM